MKYIQQEMRLATATISLICCCTSLIAATAILYTKQNKTKKQTQHDNEKSIRQNNKIRSASSSASSYESLIGNTPLIALTKLSSMIGKNVTIYVKMECMNPGGTGKDRAALSMLTAAEQSNILPSSEEGGGFVIEGTSGSTGISLAHLCRTHNHKCILFMPDDQAKEKQIILSSLGADVHIVPNCSISNPNHYVNKAKHMANELKAKGEKVLFANQFENTANFDAHYAATGPEIYEQLDGKVDAFVMSSGTGGTIAGVGSYLKEQSSKCKVVLVDPPGSVLHSRIQHGVAYVTQQCERNMLRHRYDTIAEGIGLDRICYNFSLGLPHIDYSIKVGDQEAIDMSHWILKHEGLLIGSSSAMNLVGAVKVALNFIHDNEGRVDDINVVTVLCDSGYRHLTRFWNRDFILNAGLDWPADYTNDIDKIPHSLR